MGELRMRHHVVRSACYGARVREVLEQWALLAGGLPLDRRMALLERQLEGWARNPGLGSALCADGSPVEFCERLSGAAQAPALTISNLPEQCGGASGFERAASLLELLLSTAELEALRLRLGNVAAGLEHAWLGIDFAQASGVRLYMTMKADSAASLRDEVLGTGAGALFAKRPLKHVQDVLRELFERGRNPVLGLDVHRAGSGVNGLGVKGSGVKLAFWHPLERSFLERLLDRCGLALAPLRDYMDALAALGSRAWRGTRCGLALAFSSAGSVEGLTVYHYAAPFFRTDGDLRAFAIGLANNFCWNTDVFRHSSRLLDCEGVRLRHLLGFTTGLHQPPSLRLYAQTGSYT